MSSLTSFFDRAKIGEMSEISSSEIIPAGGGQWYATLDVDVDGTDHRCFVSCAERKDSFSERVNMRKSSCVGSNTLERNVFGLMSFIVLQTGPELSC